jgi:hypothetical protein
MKRLLPFFPVLALIFLNACGNTDPQTVPDPMKTAVVQSLTATMWTPTITPTLDPNEPRILEWLNAGLPSDQLEATLDTKYQVVDVTFPIVPGSSSTVFRIDVRCQCATGNQCCVPERMFVVTMWSMKQQADKIIEQVPDSTSQVKVVCFDHVVQIGVMAATWADVKDYLRENINGYQLGSRTYRSSLP